MDVAVPFAALISPLRSDVFICIGNWRGSILLEIVETEKSARAVLQKIKGGENKFTKRCDRL